MSEALRFGPRKKASPATYRQVNEVLGGRRIKLDPSSRKVLSIVLRFRGGCDVLITPDNFSAMPLEGLHSTELLFDTAPAVLSELLLRAGVAGPIENLRTFVPPGLIIPGLEYDRKLVWLSASPERVVMHLRTASGNDERDLTSPPIPIPGLLVEAECPYCGQALRTALAKQCRFCKRNWHDPNHVKWLDGREA